MVTIHRDHSFMFQYRFCHFCGKSISFLGKYVSLEPGDKMFHIGHVDCYIAYVLQHPGCEKEDFPHLRWGMFGQSAGKLKMRKFLLVPYVILMTIYGIWTLIRILEKL